MGIETIAAAVGIAGGINSLTGGGVSKLFGGSGSTSGADAQKMADPFSQYRSKLGEMYMGALTPGSSSNIQSMPGFTQFKTGVLDPALDASKASASKSGQLYSGAESAQLTKIGEGGYSAFMTDYLNRLATGSGAGAAPSSGAGIGLAQAGLNQQGFSQGLGAISTGLSGLYGNQNQQPTTAPLSYGDPSRTFGGSGNVDFGGGQY